MTANMTSWVMSAGVWILELDCRELNIAPMEQEA